MIQGTPITASSEGEARMLLLPGIVGFYLAGRLCITYLFFQSDPKTGAAVSVALNFLMLMAVAFHSFGPADAILSSALRVPCFRWVVFFLCFSCCSLVWSATVSVGIAFIYWSAMAADVAIVVLLLRTGPMDAAAAALMKGYVCGACWIALVEWFSPTMRDLRPGNDEFFSPNAIAFTCAFGIFLAQYVARFARSWRMPAVFLAISLLRTLSKTTILAFIAGQAFLLFRDRSMSRTSKILIALVAVLIAAAFSGLISDYYVIYTNAGNQAETLTGRIGIWAVVLDKSLQQPWVGHGFDSFWNVIPLFGTFAAWHAHNELLQQFYAYGVVGIVLLAGIYRSFYLQLRSSSQAPLRALFMGLLLFIVVRGLADTERFDLSFPLWSIALISLTLQRAETVFRSRPALPAISFPQPSQRQAGLHAHPEAGHP